MAQNPTGVEVQPQLGLVHLVHGVGEESEEREVNAGDVEEARPFHCRTAQAREQEREGDGGR